MSTAKKTYAQMAAEAIVAIKDRTGSSRQAIKAHIESTYPELKFAPHNLNNALRKGVESGAFKQIKGSFKLGEKAKKPAAEKAVAKPAAKTAAAKPAAKKVGAKPAAKKATAKPVKAAAKKAAPKKKAAVKK